MSEAEVHIARLQRLKTLADNYQARTGEALMDLGQYGTVVASIAALEAQHDALPPTTEQNMRYGMLAERYMALVQASATLLMFLDVFNSPVPSIDESVLADLRAELARVPA